MGKRISDNKQKVIAICSMKVYNIGTRHKQGRIKQNTTVYFIALHCYPTETINFQINGGM